MKSLTKLKFNKIPIKNIKLHDIVKVNEFGNSRNNNLYRLNNYISICNCGNNGSYYIGKQVDNNLAVYKNGDRYEFDVGMDVDMVINKDNQNSFIVSQRETYDVLEYPYKIKTTSYEKLLYGDIVRDYDTGQLHRIVDFESTFKCYMGQRVDINLNAMKDDAFMKIKNSKFDYQDRKYIMHKEDDETIKTLNDTHGHYSYFDVLDLQKN